jgi:methyl-accepting chemotaxis protein
VLVSDGSAWGWGLGAVLASLAAGWPGVTPDAPATGLPAPWQAYLASEQRFCEQISPVWAGQIESSRQQMEQAIASLSERFGAIASALDSTLAQGGGDGTEAHTVRARSEARLNEVLQALHGSQTANQRTLSRVQGLEASSPNSRTWPRRWPRSRSRPTCWPSMRPSRRRMPARWAAASPPWPPKSARCHSAPARPARTSPKIRLINQAIAEARAAAEASALQEAEAAQASGAAIQGCSTSSAR